MPNGGPSMHDLVVTDMIHRKQFGLDKYGTPLQAHNGRPCLTDAYQEALDLVVYLRQAIEEQSPRHSADDPPVWVGTADEAARWLRGATSAGNPLYPAITRVLNDREVTRRQTVRVPVLPYPGGTSQADCYRQAADRLADGYQVGGSHMTAATVQLLRNAAASLDPGSVDVR